MIFFRKGLTQLLNQSGGVKPLAIITEIPSNYQPPISAAPSFVLP
jgi:hypothetical protein